MTKTRRNTLIISFVVGSIIGAIGWVIEMKEVK